MCTDMHTHTCAHTCARAHGIGCCRVRMMQPRVLLTQRSWAEPSLPSGFSLLRGTRDNSRGVIRPVQGVAPSRAQQGSRSAVIINVFNDRNHDHIWEGQQQINLTCLTSSPKCTSAINSCIHSATHSHTCIHWVPVFCKVLTLPAQPSTEPHSAF